MTLDIINQFMMIAAASISLGIAIIFALIGIILVLKSAKRNKKGTKKLLRDFFLAIIAGATAATLPIINPFESNWVGYLFSLAMIIFIAGIVCHFLLKHY